MYRAGGLFYRPAPAASMTGESDRKPLRLAGMIRPKGAHDPEKWVPVFGQDHAQGNRLMKMSETRELANTRALARLEKALPADFPKPALIHALARRWTPPMPRLAIDSYWRAHPLRADR